MTNSNARVLKLKDMEKLRETPRALVSQPAVGWVGEGSRKRWVRIVDVSQSGLRILDLEQKFLVGTSMFIWWRILSGLEELKLEGEIVWTKKGQCGLRFKNLGKRETHVLGQFVKFHRNEI